MLSALNGKHSNRNMSGTPDLDDNSIIDETDSHVDVDVDVEVDVDEEVQVNVDVDEVPTQKPHFLDYDAIPPPEFEEKFDRALSFGIGLKPQVEFKAHTGSTGEQLKLDKKYERDGEISDYELAASGYTKKEFTQDDNTLHLGVGVGVGVGPGAVAVPGAGAGLNDCKTGGRKGTFAKPKHFLDENPIPPDYMLEHEMREHRSLDRNFERHHEQFRTESPSALSGYGRKSSFDRSLSGARTSRERFKEPSYTLSRFLDSDSQLYANCSPSSLPHHHHRVAKGTAWTESYEETSITDGGVHLYDSVHQPLESDNLSPEVQCVYAFMSMLGSYEPMEVAKRLLEFSRSPESCAELRRAGSIPIMVQMLHSNDNNENVRKWICTALHNVVHSHPDERTGRREAKVLRLLDQIMDYCNFLRTLLQSGGEAIADDSDRHPLAAISSLMKVSFDEEHRQAMCELGALHAIPSLVHLDHAVHGPKPEEQCCNSLRRYALMALTNLTFGDEKNKALLCSQKLFMEALVAQLDSAPDDLLQVTASVLRNLSWRANDNMKTVLNEIGTVTALARAAMKNKSENTLKAILSALWNLSAHCGTNKAEFCSVDGALAFLVDMLTYEGPSKTLKIIENAGGILRNVSSHIAWRENYRQILRDRNCLSILLQQLKSESLTVVSNSCGTLWNLSARCPQDQKFLWDNGAVPMLRSLIHSKHTMISEGSSSALKNLLNFKPTVHSHNQLDPIARSMGLKKLPTLNVRKQKALERELGEKEHTEICDNLDVAPNECSKDHRPKIDGHPLHTQRLYSPLVSGGLVGSSIAPPTAIRLTRSTMLTKSESRDSIFSAKSDSVYENIMRSHSASDTNRKSHNLPFNGVIASRCSGFPLENDVEPSEEHPINYSVKYNESSTKVVAEKSSKSSTDRNSSHASSKSSDTNFATYQETDLDQPTDFSLRYAENQIESDADISPPDVTTQKLVPQVTSGNEILLILEDSVKCYQTEGTPYVISNAASVTDLRQQKIENSIVEGIKQPTNNTPVVPIKKYQRLPTTVSPHQLPNTTYGSGSYTPEKPINYYEEGTPGYFSRYDSLSSLDEAPSSHPQLNSNNNSIKPTRANVENISPTVDVTLAKNDRQSSSKNVVNLVDTQSLTADINSAQETPLMFSRHSSMDSLAEVDVGPCDDKSSVVSDFSRLASGVISPSEIPDSPTQSMPQSPRRNSSSTHGHVFLSGASPLSSGAPLRSSGDPKRILNSVFEDNLNTFHVENTPAQFSCATSLSNLSIMDDEHATLMEGSHQPVSHNHIDPTLAGSTISEGEEEEVDTGTNDDLLLASCITMGMNRNSSTLLNNNNRNVLPVTNDEAKQYYTENTPALLSKTGSNTNLSTLSICSSNIELKDENMKYDGSNKGRSISSDANRLSLNLSDDVSSNASESGGCGSGQQYDLLQQCIRDGMSKASGGTGTMSTTSAIIAHKNDHNTAFNDPIDMMRRGGEELLPRYLPVSDEINKYLVEDSPCNFSIVSGLSNLTVGSSLVGPAVQLKDNPSDNKLELLEMVPKTVNRLSTVPAHSRVAQMKREPDTNKEPQWQDDSLSSLSIDSEDDTNLLSQAIAAGCNRPKSNLGFSSASCNKRSPGLSASQPIPINSAVSASSLNSAATSRQYQRQHQQPKQNNGNESYSSVESSDSNDNQSKSLLELCILTGMHKNRDIHSNRKQHNLGSRVGKSTNEATSTQSNPNLKQFDSLPMHIPQSQKQIHLSRHQRERDRKDERLLLECINSGISKKIGESTRGRDTVFAVSPASKNVQATSAAAKGLFRPMEAITSLSVNNTAAPDVEKTINNIISTSSINKDIINTNTYGNRTSYNKDNSIINQGDISVDQKNRRNTAICAANAPSPETIQETTNDIGCKDANTNLSYSLPSDGNITNSDESNESFIMDTAVCIDQTETRATVTADKHKDPDLMLKSVERLTLEFVSSAEQLRTTQGSSEESKRKGSISLCNATNSNNTWNEDTCPNDISFPSISLTAPKVSSLDFDDLDADDYDDEQATEADHKELHDFAELTPTNEEQPQLSIGFIGDERDAFGNTQPNSLDTETDTIIHDRICDNALFTSSNGVNFQLGGEVQSAAVSTSKNIFLNNASMTNSTIIAIEARALAAHLQIGEDQYDDSNVDLTFSINNSLDLDNIRPPSGMNSLNISEYNQESFYGGYSNTQPNSPHRSFIPQSPLMMAKSPKFPHKSLPPGLVAKRALGHMGVNMTGSIESVNSSCNLLDNIRPPSLMDELLDSMISVASIQSEIADCESMATTISLSNYETAADNSNEHDDNTVTLQSCYDNIPHDDDCDADDHTSLNNSGTPMPSDNDFSSAESTPKKSSSISPPGVKRSLTPKQKRKIAKDRYKTYTIAADMMLGDQDGQASLDPQDETLQVEIIEVQEEKHNSVTRRRSSQDRYKTQTIVCPANLMSANNSFERADEQTNCSLTSTDDCLSDDMSSIRAMTSKFKYIYSPNSQTITNGNANVAPVNCIVGPLPNAEYNSIECDQNSETESCHGHSDPISETEEDLNENNTYIKENHPPTSYKSRISRPEVSKIKTIIEGAGKVDDSKTVRGQRKAPYVSPYSLHYQRSNARIATNKLLTPVLSITPAIRKRNMNGITLPSSTKLIQKKKDSDVNTAKNVTIGNSVVSLERQGTFVKEEPTVNIETVPIVESPSIQSSPTYRGSKLPTKRQQQIPLATKTYNAGSNSVRKTTFIGNNAKTTSTTNTKSIATTRRIQQPATMAPPQRSNSNSSIRITSNAARIAVLSSRVSITTPPSRSNSNLNAVTATKTSAVKINQAQSRIAGIWRRVDEAKAKQQQKQQKTNNQTTTAASIQSANKLRAQQQTKSSTALNANNTTTSETLIRSSTFDNSPPALSFGGAPSRTNAKPASTGILNIQTATAVSRIAVNRNLCGSGLPARRDYVMTRK